MDLVNKNLSVLLEEKDLDKNSLIQAIDEVFDNKKLTKMKENLSKIKDVSSSTLIMDEIYKELKGKNDKESKKEKN
jgi:UDP-N-acetylglucosamine:LPS N-acetylglucosamine transferase